MHPLDDLLVSHCATIRDSLDLINRNCRGVCFVVEGSRLVGVITDGDIRRSLLSGLNIEDSVVLAMNKNYVSLPVNSSEQLIRNSFNNKIRIIPLTDEDCNIVDFADLLKSHRIPILEPFLQGNELEYVTDCIKTGWISSQGQYVRQFEKLFQDLHPNTYALSVCNGTVALHLAMCSLGIGPGDEVIVPNLTFAASINSIIHCGATPVICDINAQSLCIDVNSVKELITPNTKAIMPVHLYGRACDMAVITQLSQEYNLLIIEDCAEALGTSINKRPVGTFGHASCFSFFGNKTISTGEGGMILFKEKSVHERAKILRDHGMNPEKRYWHEFIGYNYRLTNMQAAVGKAQLEQFDSILASKRRILNLYNNYLCGRPEITFLPSDTNESFHSNWLYTILLESSLCRDSVIKDLAALGIDTRPIFYPLHEMKPYQEFRRASSLNVSICASKHGISLPSSPSLCSDEISFIVKSLINSLTSQ